MSSSRNSRNMTAILARLSNSAWGGVFVKFRTVFWNSALSARNDLRARILHVVAIIRLFFESCPSYISRFIVSVSIRPSIKRMVGGRSRAYIGKEVDKSVWVQPSFRYLSSLRAPSSLVRLVLGVQASSLYCAPRYIFRRGCTLTFMSMLKVHGNMITPFEGMRARR